MKRRQLPFTACLLAKRQRSLLEAFSGMPRDEGRGNCGDLQGERDSGEKSATKAGAFSGMLPSYDGGGGHSHSGWEWADDSAAQAAEKGVSCSVHDEGNCSGSQLFHCAGGSLAEIGPACEADEHLSSLL